LKHNVDDRRYRGLLRHERRAGRRARLLATGLELFGTTGFGRTTIPMLCGTAGVAVRHFYDDFDSRESLLKEIYDEIASGALEAVRAVLKDPQVSGAARIRRSNEAYFTELTGDPRRARIYALEAVGVSAELEQHRRATREAFITLIVPPQPHVIPPLDNRLLSVAVAGAAHALLLEWVLAAHGPSVETMIDTVTTLWLRTLRA
jgi:AcrR family transcriptional regulator